MKFVDLTVEMTEIIRLAHRLKSLDEKIDSDQWDVHRAEYWRVLHDLLKKASRIKVDPDGTSYGRCPVCKGRGIARERRPDGNDRCENGHTYLSRNSIQ